MEETTGNEIDIQGIETQRMCSDASTSEDFVSGLMKIIPDVDVSHHLKEWRNVIILVDPEMCELLKCLHWKNLSLNLILIRATNLWVI